MFNIPCPLINQHEYVICLNTNFSKDFIIQMEKNGSTYFGIYCSPTYNSAYSWELNV